MPQSIACRFCHQLCSTKYATGPNPCHNHADKTIYYYEANQHSYELIIAIENDPDVNRGYSMGWMNDQLTVWEWDDGAVIWELPSINVPIPSSIEEADKLLQRILTNMAFL